MSFFKDVSTIWPIFLHPKGISVGSHDVPPVLWNHPYLITGALGDALPSISMDGLYSYLIYRVDGLKDYSLDADGQDEAQRFRFGCVPTFPSPLNHDGLMRGSNDYTICLYRSPGWPILFSLGVCTLPV